MIKIFLLGLTAMLLINCSSEPSGIPIGFSTELRLKKEDRLFMTERNYKFFTDILQTDSKSHFSGKMYLAFDTIYTSTLQRSIGTNPMVMYTDYEADLIHDTINQGLRSMLFFRNGWFVYRTFVPEPAHKQTVVIDVAGTDSTKIAGYFYSATTNGIIKL
jgi:hypothetical protein